uniref:Ac120-like protein n=1 Tax=Oryctes rhinoceros nudivirus TaxID=92521 RepID=A0A7D3UF14_9VIRU|nr:Ac120-like protein [Oryctes rhinoceros nudivirus]UBO76509.1 Ac120-like protein [Oryctes rhinoceros nudivirus]
MVVVMMGDENGTHSYLKLYARVRMYVCMYVCMYNLYDYTKRVGYKLIVYLFLRTYACERLYVYYIAPRVYVRACVRVYTCIC